MSKIIDIASVGENIMYADEEGNVYWQKEDGTIVLVTTVQIQKPLLFSSNGKTLFVGGVDPKIYHFKISDELVSLDSTKKITVAENTKIELACFSENSNTLFYSDEKGKLVRLNLITFEEKIISILSDCPISMAVSSDNTLLAFGFYKGVNAAENRVINLKTGEVQKFLTKHVIEVFQFYGTDLFCADREGEVSLFKDNKLFPSQIHLTNWATASLVSNEKLLMTGRSSMCVVLDSGNRQLAQLFAKGKDVTAVGLTEKRLILVSDGKLDIRLIDKDLQEYNLMILEKKFKDASKILEKNPLLHINPLAKNLDQEFFGVLNQVVRLLLKINPSTKAEILKEARNQVSPFVEVNEERRKTIIWIFNQYSIVIEFVFAVLKHKAFVRAYDLAQEHEPLRNLPHFHLLDKEVEKTLRSAVEALHQGDVKKSEVLALTLVGVPDTEDWLNILLKNKPVITTLNFLNEKGRSDKIAERFEEYPILLKYEPFKDLYEKHVGNK